VTRWAMEDLVIGGSQIRRGDSVGLLLGIANRDPRRFVRPDVLDPERADGGHVSFGSGIHACLGAALARAEAEIALGLILEQMPRLRLAHEPIKWRDSLVFHGPEALRVAWG
jgi:cytochrome P450